MSEHKVTAVVGRITPALAKEWLEKNSVNRPLNRNRVLVLAAAMREGRWLLNGETIIRTADGQLLNGQHRLHAVIMSGVTIESVVVTGPPTSVFPTLDRPGVRTIGQNTKMSGYANGTAVASAAAVLLVEESGELSGAWGRRWEPDQILDCIKRHPLLPLSVSLTKQTASLFHISAGVAGWLHYRFGSSDATLRDLFFDTLHTGKALGEADPVAALRNRLTKEAGARARLTQKDQAVLIIRAWNAVREGRRLVILKATIRGEKDYQFPAISGASPVGKAS